MHGTYLGKLLDNVLNGDEIAYKQFLNDRLNLPQQCSLMEMLSYLIEQAKLNENGLNRCYPEALVELGYFIDDISNTDNIQIRGQIKEFIELLYQAAFAGNVGAQTILVLTIDSINDPHYTSGFTEFALPQNLDDCDQHHLILNATIAILLALDPQKQNASMVFHFLKCKFNKTTVAQEHSDAINSLNVPSDLQDASNGFVSPEECELEAVACLEKAVALGNIVALVNLGSMYLHGKAGKALASQEERDLKAVECFEKASMLGNAVALANLGIMYFDGIAGKALASQEERDLKGEKCLEKASILGNTVALVHLGRMYLLGKAGKGLASQEKRDLKALECFEKACILGSVDAHFELGLMYLNKRIGKELSTKESLEKSENHFLMYDALKHFDLISEKSIQLQHSPVPILPSPPLLLAEQSSSAINYKDAYESQQIWVAALDFQIIQLNSLLDAKEQLIQKQQEIINGLNEQLSHRQQKIPTHTQQYPASSSRKQQKLTFSSAGTSTFFSAAGLDTATSATVGMDTESSHAIENVSSSAEKFNSNSRKQ